jgi:predicted nucleic acid binding AN1-type Zn finger protein
MECQYCKKAIELFPYKCKFCLNDFCKDHYLPEKHNCGSLKRFKEETQRLRKQGKAGFRGPKSEYLSEMNFFGNPDDSK